MKKLDYFQRFSDALEFLVQATPPEDSVRNWILDEWSDEVQCLQSWVLEFGNQPFWWNQGITILDAVHAIADAPIEGQEYHDKIDYTCLHSLQEEHKYQERVKSEKHLSTCSKEELLEELTKRL